MTNKFKDIANKHKDFPHFLKSVFPVVMQWEGGGKLHNVSGDSGGWTLWGIAYNFNKQHFDSLEDFKNTTRDEAAAFAFVEYFLPLSLDLVPQNCRLYCFDMAYNMGVHRAKVFMQSCAGVTADGIFGAKTKSALHKVTLECLHKKRTDFYATLAKQPKNKKFYNGWMNRARDIYKRSL